MNSKIERARKLRKSETKSESLLWNTLRAKQLCGLKFRRQHPVPPYVLDFACIEAKLAIEIDGGYHDLVGEYDLARERLLKSKGWTILRFSDEDVEEDVELVARAIAKTLGLKFRFHPPKVSCSGMKLARKSRPSPGSTLPGLRPTLPEGG